MSGFSSIHSRFLGETESYICSNCRSRFVMLHHDTCPFCGASISTNVGAFNFPPKSNNKKAPDFGSNTWYLTIFDAKGDVIRVFPGDSCPWPRQI